MVNKYLEVELMFPLVNPDETERRLYALGAPAKEKLYQKDVYYNAPHRDFLATAPTREWLRIRQTPEGASLNYKFWHNKDNEQAVSCDEFETKVSDAEAVAHLLGRLDFKPLVTVEKTRSIWNYRDVEISLDNVTDLGWFVEVEAKGDFGTIERAAAQLYAVLEELNVQTGPQDYKGYPHLLLEKQGYTFPTTNLTKSDFVKLDSV